jgi:hypothetical protein
MSPRNQDSIESAIPFSRTFVTNTFGPVMLTQALLPNILCSPSPRLRFMSSHVSSIDYNTTGGMYAYRSSKAALNSLARSLAMDPQGSWCNRGDHASRVCEDMNRSEYDSPSGGSRAGGGRNKVVEGVHEQGYRADRDVLASGWPGAAVVRPCMNTRGRLLHIPCSRITRLLSRSARRIGSGIL